MVFKFNIWPFKSASKLVVVEIQCVVLPTMDRPATTTTTTWNKMCRIEIVATWSLPATILFLSSEIRVPSLSINFFLFLPAAADMSRIAPCRKLVLVKQHMATGWIDSCLTSCLVWREPATFSCLAPFYLLSLYFFFLKWLSIGQKPIIMSNHGHLEGRKKKKRTCFLTN